MNTNVEKDNNSVLNRFTIRGTLVYFYFDQKNGNHPFKTVRTKNMNEAELIEYIEASGFNIKHPKYDLLCDMVRETFTIEEVVEFLSCLSFEEISDVKIERAKPLGGRLMDRRHSDDYGPEIRYFKFSYLDGCTPSFSVMGNTPGMDDDIPF